MDNKAKISKAIAIIPAYNEAQNIVKTVESLKNIKGVDYIVINDGSTDNTLDVLLKNKIRHINLLFNLGIGGAVQTGYKYAYYNHYDIAIQFDGDGQHNAFYIKDLIREINNGYDMVIGSRFISDKNKFKSTALRQLGIGLINKNIKFKTGFSITDSTSGFRAVNKDIIKYFSNKYPYDFPEPITTSELLLMNKKVKEIPVEMNAREFGKSSINFLKPVIYMLKVNFSILSIKKRTK